MYRKCFENPCTLLLSALESDFFLVSRLWKWRNVSEIFYNIEWVKIIESLIKPREIRNRLKQFVRLNREWIGLKPKKKSLNFLRLI